MFIPTETHKTILITLYQLGISFPLLATILTAFPEEQKIKEIGEMIYQETKGDMNKVKDSVVTKIIMEMMGKYYNEEK